jgi:hypothetical protein
MHRGCCYHNDVEQSTCSDHTIINHLFHIACVFEMARTNRIDCKAGGFCQIDVDSLKVVRTFKSSAELRLAFPSINTSIVWYCLQAERGFKRCQGFAWVWESTIHTDATQQLELFRSLSSPSSHKARGMYRCKTCLKELPINAFSKKLSSISSKCKLCAYRANVQYRSTLSGRLTQMLHDSIGHAHAMNAVHRGSATHHKTGCAALSG